MDNQPFQPTTPPRSFQRSIEPPPRSPGGFAKTPLSNDSMATVRQTYQDHHLSDLRSSPSRQLQPLLAGRHLHTDMSLSFAPDSHNRVFTSVEQSSASPEPTGTQASSSKHRRNYQACNRCRERKVKCELGPVDAPNQPPCARCRRENKQCDFAEERKKRKSASPPGGSDDGYGQASRKRPRTTSETKPAPTSHPYEVNEQTYNANSSVDPILQPSPSTFQYDQPMANYNPRVSSDLHRQALRPSKSVPAQTEKDHMVRSEGAEGMMKKVPATVNTSIEDLLTAASGLLGPHVPLDRFQADMLKSAGGPLLDSEEHLSPEQKQERLQAIEAWNKLRFVKVGFFRPEEGIQYIDYFYNHLQPMTPVILPDFRDRKKHAALLRREPILSLTLLLISSRYMKLSGRSHWSRSFEIHKHLWIALGTKIQRLLLGQEQFGGGFTGAGAANVQESSTGQLTWLGTLRTLGTIEALLLLTDWQPKSLHFPPGDDDTALVEGNFANLAQDDTVYSSGAHQLNAQTGSAFASWLEPAWRSDRMSWMLLNVAQALAFELGVFDYDKNSATTLSDPESGRKRRIRRLVLTYTAQVSGRMGIPTALKISDWESSSFEHHTDPIDIMQGLWINIAGIMNRANREIFPSREYTRSLTSGQSYRGAIAAFAPDLAKWQARFEQIKEYVPEVMQHILMMEFEYARLYINSLGLQHVVESWVRPGVDIGKMQAGTGKAVTENKHYIDELTDAALHILDIVVNKLGSLGLIRDAPVRTFLRALSALMFTLKRLSLGNHEKQVRRSIDLLERTVAVLQEQVIDDVHLSASTAQLIGIIIAKVKQTMIRVQKPTATSSAPSRDQSRPTSPPRVNNGESEIFDRGHTFNGSTTVTSATTGYSINDPIASIQARPMDDYLNSNRPFVPPPNFNFQTNDFDYLDDTIDTSVASGEPNDWLAMDLSNVYNKPEFQVDQGSYSIGPMIGEQDLLEILTNSPTQPRWNGPAGNQQYQHYGGL